MQVKHIKCTSFQFKYIGRIPVLPDYNGGHGCYLIRNIQHYHINNRNITACYSEYPHDLHYKHVIVRMLLDFPNVRTKVWPTVSQMETTFRRGELLWANAKRVVVKNPDSCPNLGPIGCPETSLRNYHYSLHNSREERSSHLLRGVKPEITQLSGELLCSHLQTQK